MSRSTLTLRLVVTGWLAASALAASASAQGETGFLRGAGRTDFAVSYLTESWDQLWIGDQRSTPAGLGDVSRESLQVYLAHGLEDDLDLVITAAYTDTENDGTTSFNDERALQDGTVGFKWRASEESLGAGQLSFLLAPSVKIPMSHYETKSATALGDGQIDWRGRAILHYRIENGAFLSIESGYDYRTESPANEYPLNVTVGATFFDHVTVMPFWSRVWSKGHGDIGQVALPKVEEEFERYGVTALVRVHENVLLQGGWKTTVDGRNTPDLTGWWAGMVFRF